ncbi:MAG: WbqC family protein, partial [Xanthomonadales bacterium]|nr:WbqC family protein [Xanthomonadales bacterium]
MARTVFIHQSNYIPWKGFFDALNMADEFIIYDVVQYTKQDWRNRNRILTADGPRWLTIPVTVRTLGQRINA